MSSHGVRPNERSSSDEHILSDDVPERIPSLDSVGTPDDEAPSLHIDLHLQSSGSGDEMGSSIFENSASPIAPDPILGAIAAAEEAAHVERAHDEFPQFSDAAPASPSSRERVDRTHPSDSQRPPEFSPASDSGEIQEEVVYVNGPNWPMLLLASYASAVTLALIWLLIIPRLRGKSDLDGFTPGATSVPVGSRKTPHKVEPAPPIPPEHMAKLGQAFKIGSLEITPLEIAREDVKLRRKSISGEVEDKEGGHGAMTLRLKLHNTSTDVVFSPIDEAFIRDRDNGLSDSFVQLESGERVYLYPLSVESEWSIVDQTFPDLKPGEVKETRVVTAADFPTSTGELTWHLRVRTGLDATETIGVLVPSGK